MDCHSLPVDRGGRDRWSADDVGGVRLNFGMIRSHVDRLSGKAHAVPTRSTATATGAAHILRDMRLLSGDGFPDVLVVGQDAQVR